MRVENVDGVHQVAPYGNRKGSGLAGPTVDASKLSQPNGLTEAASGRERWGVNGHKPRGLNKIPDMRAIVGSPAMGYSQQGIVKAGRNPID